MNDFALVYIYLHGLKQARQEAMSALPDAPVIPDHPRRAGRNRLRLTAWLRSTTVATRRTRSAPQVTLRDLDSLHRLLPRT